MWIWPLSKGKRPQAVAFPRVRRPVFVTTPHYSVHRIVRGETLESRTLLAADQLVVSEFLAVNDDLLRDYDDNDSDWIELRNDDSETVDLAGWYLTDDRDNLAKWQVPVPTQLLGN